MTVDDGVVRPRCRLGYGTDRLLLTYGIRIEMLTGRGRRAHIDGGLARAEVAECRHRCLYLGIVGLSGALCLLISVGNATVV